MSFRTEARRCLGVGDANDLNLRYFEEFLHLLIPFVGAGLSAEFGYPTWSELLRRIAAQHGLNGEVEPYIARREFEEAAELMERIKPGALAASLRTMLDPARLPSAAFERAAVRHLPRLTAAFVVTTNFDGILEVVFDRAGKPFSGVYPGTSIVQASRAVQQKGRVLLKLHGTYDTDAGRVLTLTEYRTHYISDEATIDRQKPLPSVLEQALGAHPVLFVGCSLQTDRTVGVIASLIERLPGLTHFALLSEHEDTVERRQQLKDWNIWPLFFRAHEFARVESFLALAADYAERARREEARHSAAGREEVVQPSARSASSSARSVSSRLRLPALGVSLLLLAATVMFLSSRGVDDPLRRVRTAEAARAA